MKNQIKLIESALELVQNVFVCRNMTYQAKDVEWSLAMVRRFNRYDPEWSQYSVVRCIEVFTSAYHDCLSAASRCRKEGDELMRSNYHKMANNYVDDLKRISMLL